MTNETHKERHLQLKNNIVSLRKERRMSQKDLANKAGISITFLNQIENANVYTNFSLSILFNIADALNVEAQTLLL